MSDTVVALKEDIRYRIIGAEGVIVRQNAGEVIVVNEIGASIVAAIDGKTSVDVLIDKIHDAYDVDKEQAAQDVLAFLDEIVKVGVAEFV